MIQSSEYSFATMPHFNKLVRDRIPEIIEKNGETAYIRIAEVAEYKELLEKKLYEEVEEFLANPSEEEAADILEVLRAIAGLTNTTLDSVEAVRQEKYAKRGGFEKRIVLIETRDGTEDAAKDILLGVPTDIPTNVSRDLPATPNTPTT